MLIGFTATDAVEADASASVPSILSKRVVVPAGGRHDFGLIHLVHTGQRPTEIYLDQIGRIDPAADAGRTIQAWHAWFKDVSPEFALDRLPAGRVRDLVEGGLSYLKTNQSSDGALVANIPIYPFGWTRDAYCGLRGLLATGHCDESRRFLLHMHRKFLAHDFIPNAMSCGSDSFALYNGNGEHNPGRHMGAASPWSTARAPAAGAPMPKRTMPTASQTDAASARLRPASTSMPSPPITGWA